MTTTSAGVVGTIVLAWMMVRFFKREDEPAPAEQARMRRQQLLAEGEALDDQWKRDLKAEEQRIIARIRAGDLDAALTPLNWPHCDVAVRHPDELIEGPGMDSVIRIRRQRRLHAHIAAADMVQRARMHKQGEIDWQEREQRAVQLQQERQEAERRRAQEEAANRAKQERERQQREAAERARQERINRKVLRPWPLQADAGVNGITFGTRVADGTDLIVALKRLQHMLVVGATGAGKSVFVHQLVYQLIERLPDVERVFIFDLKGGIEFNRYRANPRTRLVWEFADVAKELEQLSALMLQRETEMRANNLQNWPGKRVFVIIDEYAEIQSEIDSATTKDEKAAARQVTTALVRIGRRARALGIVLVCALQKATTDAMDSALRANLNCRICLRVNSRQFASSVLDGLDDVPIDPLALKPGHFIYYDAARGELDHAVAQIAPGVNLEGY